jgi:hypothetical protein
VTNKLQNKLYNIFWIIVKQKFKKNYIIIFLILKATEEIRSGSVHKSGRPTKLEVPSEPEHWPKLYNTPGNNDGCHEIYHAKTIHNSLTELYFRVNLLRNRHFFNCRSGFNLHKPSTLKREHPALQTFIFFFFRFCGQFCPS